MIDVVVVFSTTITSANHTLRRLSPCGYRYRHDELGSIVVGILALYPVCCVRSDNLSLFALLE